MSKCLRCGAGNEWIEPVAKEAKKPRRRRPKVRFVAGSFRRDGHNLWHVTLANREPSISRVCECYTRGEAKRIAAALNLYEAVRRGEV